MTKGAEPGRATLLIYGLPAFPLAILSLPFYVLLPTFYSQTVGLSLALVGQVLFAIRVVDALSDPVVGVLCDRFRPGFGRRRLWVLLAAPGVALAAAFIFMPPVGAGALYLAVWGLALSIAWTAFQVPYAAWGAELSRSYEGRTRVVAFREAFTVVGTLLALCVPTVLPALGFTGERTSLMIYAITVATLLPLTAIWLVARVNEPQDRSSRHIPFREGLAHMAANRPFLRLIAAFFINGLANGLPATLFLFYVERKLQAGEWAGPLLVLYFVCGVAGIPFGLWLARRTSKHRAWAIGMLTAIAAFAAAPFLGPGDVAIFVAVTVATGLALGADVVLPAALQADVIDVDTASSGEERAGLYLSVWAFATKLALAGAVGIAFPVLAAFGFDPARDLETTEGLMALGLLYAGLPLLLKAVAVALVWHFPLDRDTLGRLRAQIDAGRSRQLL
jgi:glycoside/pentoside/hexuronide:cation symporter, GPH family